MIVQVYALLGQIEGERNAFLGEFKDGRLGAVRDYPQVHLAAIRDEKSISLSYEIRNNLSPYLLFISPTYK